jgi:exodeoxyribonuclease VII large subunit
MRSGRVYCCVSYTKNKLAGKKLNQAKANNERLMTLMREQVVRRIAEQRNQLSLLMQTIHNAKKKQLNQARHQIKLLMEQVLLGDPKRILKRGYAIVRNREQKIMTRKAVAQKETSLIIEFQDGQINCGQAQEIALQTVIELISFLTDENFGY